MLVDKDGATAWMAMKLLINELVKKGVLTPDEADRIGSKAESWGAAFVEDGDRRFMDAVKAARERKLPES